MNPVFRSALVIARRDYVATVWSRTFILFLIGPLLPVLFGVSIGSVGAGSPKPPAPTIIAILATPAQVQAINQSREELGDAVGHWALPQMIFETPQGDQAAQGRQFLDSGKATAVVSGLPDKPIFSGPPDVVRDHADLVARLLEDARRSESLSGAGIAVPKITLRRVPVAVPAKPEEPDHTTLAHAAQLLLLFLTMILAGMLLSNMMEEKGNKIIEILAAAVPIDGIFVGKLFGMLSVSLTGIAAWTLAALAAAVAFTPPDAIHFVAPAIGWPAFVLLGIVYFIASYLLLGALFLGIGAQANTVREVQTMSMPLTFGQLLIFGLAATVVDRPDSMVGIIASVFPWSSPFAMLARAAERPEIWPHLIAIAWQALAVFLIIRISAAMFRRSVLKSGRGGLWKRLIGRSSRSV